MKRTLLAMALLLTSVFGVAGCGSDDDVPPAESRIKNSTGDDEIERLLKNVLIDEIDYGDMIDDITDDYIIDDEIDYLDDMTDYEDMIDYDDMSDYDDEIVYDHRLDLLPGKDKKLDIGRFIPEQEPNLRNSNMSWDDKLDLMRDHIFSHKIPSMDLRGEPDFDADGNPIWE